MLGTAQPPRDADGDEEGAGPWVFKANEEARVAMQPTDSGTDAWAHHGESTP